MGGPRNVQVRLGPEKVANLCVWAIKLNQLNHVGRRAKGHINTAATNAKPPRRVSTLWCSLGFKSALSNTAKPVC